MPLTPNGIFYADNKTPMAVQDIYAAMSTSVSNNLNVLQVVNFTQDTQVLSTSLTEYTDSLLSAQITPSSIDSKVLVLVNLKFYSYTSGISSNLGGDFRLLRSSSVISNSSVFIGAITRTSFILTYYNNYTLAFLDEPQTISNITYGIEGRAIFSTTSGTPSGGLRMNETPSNITLLEIGQ